MYKRQNNNIPGITKDDPSVMVKDIVSSDCWTRLEKDGPMRLFNDRKTVSLTPTFNDHGRDREKDRSTIIQMDRLKRMVGDRRRDRLTIASRERSTIPQ